MPLSVFVPPSSLPDDLQTDAILGGNIVKKSWHTVTVLSLMWLSLNCCSELEKDALQIPVTWLLNVQNVQKRVLPEQSCCFAYKGAVYMERGRS